MGLKFTKVKRDEESTPKGIVETPSPVEKEEGKKDSIPTPPVEKEAEQKKVGGIRGIPNSVRPPSRKNNDEEVTETPVKKDKPQSSEIPTVSPTPPKGKPGRKPGSTNKPAHPKGREAKIEKLAQKVEGFYALADVWIPGMRINHPQGVMYAEAIQDVLDEFDFGLSPKATAIVNLVTVTAIINVDKVPLVVNHLNKAKKNARIVQQAQRERQGIPTDNPQIPTPQPKPQPSTPPAQPPSNDIWAHVNTGIAKGEN